MEKRTEAIVLSETLRVNKKELIELINKNYPDDSKMDIAMISTLHVGTKIEKRQSITFSKILEV